MVNSDRDRAPDRLNDRDAAEGVGWGVAERLTARQAATAANVALRTIQVYAAQGKIPGARQLVDGGNWSFDAAKFQRWLRQREDPRCQVTPPISTGGTGGPTLDFKSVGARSDEAYRRAIGLRPSEG